jgi:hypothetical protein
VAGVEPAAWSWGAALFGPMPGVEYFHVVRLDEPFGWVNVVFMNGYRASVTVNHGHATVGRYELAVIAPDGTPARPVGVDDDAVIDALRAISARYFQSEALDPDQES